MCTHKLYTQATGPGALRTFITCAVKHKFKKNTGLALAKIGLGRTVCKAYSAYVTGPAKTGHVDTNYTLLHDKLFFSTASENL